LDEQGKQDEKVEVYLSEYREDYQEVIQEKKLLMGKL